MQIQPFRVTVGTRRPCIHRVREWKLEVVDRPCTLPLEALQMWLLCHICVIRWQREERLAYAQRSGP